MSVLGHYFGVLGYKQLSLDDIAMMQTMTVNGAFKPQKTAIKWLRELYPTSVLKLFKMAYQAIMRKTEKVSGDEN